MNSPLLLAEPEFLAEEVERFESISLREMDSVALLNRVDTKYVIPVEALGGLFRQLGDGYRILLSDQRRTHVYRTLYFDTKGCNMFLMHQNGRASRVKVRERWYVGANKAYFEVKRRTNRDRTVKRRFALPTPFSGGAYADPSSEELAPYRGWLRENCPFDVSALLPQTWTQFERITLVNLAVKERVTIDFHLQFCDAGGINASKSAPDSSELRTPRRQKAIVEVKRSGAHQRSPVVEALRSLRLWPASFSKYCIGTALLRPAIKQNRFKPTLRSLGGLKP
jgi:hypothetical protein